MYDKGMNVTIGSSSVDFALGCTTNKVKIDKEIFNLFILCPKELT